MDKFLMKFILILLIIKSSLINCYNNTLLKKVTKDDISGYHRENGYEGCYALYDSGANDTETCTQFKLEYPYTCCRVHYELDGYKNDFCMSIANNADAIGDVVDAFDNADELDIDCHSFMIKSFMKLLLFIIFILF